MPWGLQRYQQCGQLHFVTFSCYRRQPLLSEPGRRALFETVLEETRRSYQFYIVGYVVMPEHVHLLISEPERGNMAAAIQSMKQASARRSRRGGGVPLRWQIRYYDFNVFSVSKRQEKLRYLHRNPVERGLVESPEEWENSSYRHYLTGEEGRVCIESHWTAARREKAGDVPRVKIRSVDGKATTPSKPKASTTPKSKSSTTPKSKSSTTPKPTTPP
jgi:putative transposase